MALSEESQAESTADFIEPSPTGKERGLGCLYSSVAFFVSYVVSAGPAAFMTKTFDQPMFNRIVEVIYCPLILLVKSRVPVISPIIKAWIGLFT